MTISNERLEIIIGAVVVIQIKMLESYDLVEFNPFWEKSRGIFEFHTSR
jgi:hypothetical protein